MILDNYGIYLINFAVAGIMLLFTSYLDLRKREVEDKVWVIFGIIGLVLQVYEVANGETDLVQLLIGVGLGALVGMGLYFFGFYGGADGKALDRARIARPALCPPGRSLFRRAADDSHERRFDIYPPPARSVDLQYLDGSPEKADLRWIRRAALQKDSRFASRLPAVRKAARLPIFDGKNCPRF